MMLSFASNSASVSWRVLMTRMRSLNWLTTYHITLSFAKIERPELCMMHQLAPLSLNDCLHTGPIFNQRILEILVRFQSYHVAVVADIEKAFLMISVTPRDRNMLRFLWMSDPFQDNPQVIAIRFAKWSSGFQQARFY